VTRRFPPVVLFLFFLAGACALVYQLVWIRLLTQLLGGTSWAISTVLAAFMGGLAIGSRRLGERADRVERPLRMWAALELGIGLLGALVPLLVAVLTPLYVGAHRATPEGSHFLLPIAVAFLVLLPPTILMGGTLPVLSRWFVRADRRLGRGLGALYSVNTLGAMAGCFLAGFVLVEALGLRATTAVAVAGNLFVALAAWTIDGIAGDSASSASAVPAEERTASTRTAEIGTGLLAVIFALSGAAALAYEIFWTRALQHFLGNSTYAYSAMLTTFLLGLGAGGWIGGQLADRLRSPARCLGWVQIAIGATALATIPLIWIWLPSFEASSTGPTGWLLFIARRFFMAFAVMIVPATLLGATFPLVSRIGVRGLAQLGGRVGFLYFANTLGAILGSLAAGFVALPLLGARAAIVAASAVNLALGVSLHLACGTAAARVPWAPAATAALVLVAGVPGVRWAGVILSDTQTRADEILYDAEDSFAETRVYRKPNGEKHMSVDGHHVGGTNANILRKEKILAHLPMALAPRAADVLAVGLGSGITLGTFALYDEIESLTCVEIAPGVVRGAVHFRDEHDDVLEDPRTEIHVADGAQFLLTTERLFDVISSDSKLNPEYVGNGALLSREYYELCRDRLRDGGVMVQWLALNLPPSELRVIARTHAEAFVHAAIYWHDPSNVILAGSSERLAFRMDRMERFARDERVGPDLASIHLDSPYAMASLRVTEDEGLRAAVGSGPVNTWSRPRTEFSMIRSRLERAGAAAENANLRWLRDIRRRDAPPIAGGWDAETMRRWVASGGKLLEGYAAAGGVEALPAGDASFREGLALNPDDRRLQLLTQRIAQVAAQPSR
jgi:spermidine synthase